jgi:hypothetical protein
MTPPAAQAGHDNGTRLCSEKFAGKFKHARHVPTIAPDTEIGGSADYL